ncbi:MAG: SusD/RagB family nutrient-binding outer membrane lipoprotein [Bacteroidota bacterium]|nr:SusD/RagB family nutrient-binding outer membrane lipoprotein [Bacteroidota bacterium]
MKNKIIIYTALFALAFTGCKKSWLDVNTNPNQLPTATPDFVFTSGVARTVAFLGPNETGSYWSGQWTQSSTYIIVPSTFQYQFNNTNFNFWDTWYDIMQDFQFVINATDAKSYPYFKGPARVMKAYIMHQVVDDYGDAPYTDAFRGLGSIAPKFDNQKAIYEDLIKVLDTAISDLRANPFTGSYATTIAASDIVFNGNVTNWIRFANSLKMRLLIRQSRIPGRDAYIIPEINKAAATPEGFLAVGQDVTANPGYIASTGKQNPFYENWGYNAAGGAQALARFPRPTTFLFNTLIASNDTFRLKRLAYPKGGEGKQPEILSNYVGVPFGVSSGYLSQNTSYLGPSVIKKGEFNRPMYIMLAAESFFSLAEAKQLYGAAVTLPLTAKTYYETGVQESFRTTGTTTAYGADKVTTLLNSGKDLADWNASPDKLKAIWMQKWLALTNFSGQEAWSEYRRTNFPVTPASASAPAGSKPPVRLFYPSSESGSNPNVPMLAPNDVFEKRVFWDID